MLEVWEGSVCFGGGFWFVCFGVVLLCFAQALEPQFSNQECLGSLTADVPHPACQTLHKVFIRSITWSLCQAPSTCVGACLGKQKWRGEQSSSAGVISTLLTTRSYSWLTVLTSWRFRDQGTVRGIDPPDHVNGEMAVPDNDASRNLLASE